MRQPSIMFLIRSLERGGAERQVVLLAQALSQRGWSVAVTVFYDGGIFAKDLEASNIRVHRLRKRGRWHTISFLFRLFSLIRRERPGILYSFMPMANMLALPSKLFLHDLRVVWGVRSSAVDLKYYDRLTRLEYSLERQLARFADLVITNSKAATKQYADTGLSSGKLRTVPNGIDTNKFNFDPAGRQRLRQEWGLGSNSVMVGQVGRLDPMKGIPVFLEAAALLSKRNSRYRFIFVCGQQNADIADLVRRATSFGLSDRVKWLGPRDDISTIYSALDILVSASIFGEGFPNVVAEAMACGCPCVVTAVGDSPQVVGHLGIVVPPKDPTALAAGVEEMLGRLDAQGEPLRDATASRVRTAFGIEQLVGRTLDALAPLIATDIH